MKKKWIAYEGLVYREKKGFFRLEELMPYMMEAERKRIQEEAGNLLQADISFTRFYIASGELYTGTDNPNITKEILTNSFRVKAKKTLEVELGIYFLKSSMHFIIDELVNNYQETFQVTSTGKLKEIFMEKDEYGRTDYFYEQIALYQKKLQEEMLVLKMVEELKETIQEAYIALCEELAKEANPKGPLKRIEFFESLN